MIVILGAGYISNIFLCQIINSILKIFFDVHYRKGSIRRRKFMTDQEKREASRIDPGLAESIVLLDERDFYNWQFMEDYIKSLPYGDRL